ncbi:MAG: PspC domain-containing protein [Candidatus Microsaccharimonas sp.]
MNEITRIHIAKTAYDVEVAAKKQLEKYIKSLESYTQDTDVLADIEIRMTELLAERNVQPGGVIGSDDVAAIRAQLGEPHEFADGEGDIAVGATAPEQPSGRRLYRSADDAVLGGVLSGIATYFNVNPLWVRLAFIALLFISFGFASLVYIVMWIVVPLARTATEKLQLAGKNVTLESIRALNAEEEGVTAVPRTPILQQVVFVGAGIASLLSAVGTFLVTAWLIIGALTFNDQFVNMMNGMAGLGEGEMWIVWFVFVIVVLGLLLLTALFGLIAYAFLARKLNKRIVVSGVIIIALGITSFAAVLGISTSQSWRVANETRSMVRETKANLSKEFASVKTVEFTTVHPKNESNKEYFFSGSVQIRYVVDEGPARYELSALPSTKPTITVDGTTAKISVSVPESFRNSFVQPELTVYGPALDSIKSENSTVEYAGLTQASLSVKNGEEGNVSVSGAFNSLAASGNGSIDLSSSSIQSLTVVSEQHLSVTAGTVRELTITQPDVCPSNTYSDNTRVHVAGVTAGTMTYNTTVMDAKSHQTSCAVVIVGDEDDFEAYDDEYSYRYN